MRPGRPPRVSQAAIADTGPCTVRAPAPQVRSSRWPRASRRALPAGGEQVEDVVDERGAEVGRQVGEGEPGVRSTPCTHSSLARIHGTSVAGIVLPCMLRTVRRPGLVGHRLDRLGEPGARPRRSRPAAPPAGRAAVAAISASRTSREGYIGVSTPVRAQVSRLTSASALRARWATTCARDQSGSGDGAAQVVVGQLVEPAGDGELAVGPPAEVLCACRSCIESRAASRRTRGSVLGPSGLVSVFGRPLGQASGDISAWRRRVRCRDRPALARAARPNCRRPPTGVR